MKIDYNQHHFIFIPDIKNNSPYSHPMRQSYGIFKTLLGGTHGFCCNAL